MVFLPWAMSLWLQQWSLCTDWWISSKPRPFVSSSPFCLICTFKTLLTEFTEAVLFVLRSHRTFQLDLVHAVTPSLRFFRVPFSSLSTLQNLYLSLSSVLPVQSQLIPPLVFDLSVSCNRKTSVHVPCHRWSLKSITEPASSSRLRAHKGWTRRSTPNALVECRWNE